MFNLPVFKTVWAKAVERAVVVAVAAGLTDLLNNANASWVAKGGVVYFALKTLVDLLNKNIPNT